MKVLIGTPVHQSKDYSLKRWLENVANLIKVTPADIFLVDNSSGADYSEKVKEYCTKLGLETKIIHIDIPDSGKEEKEKIHERIAKSRELIRKELIKGNYDAWFCWESDQIIPPDGLKKLEELMSSGDFMVVDHNCWVNDKPGVKNFDYGVTLINRKCLKKYSFIPHSKKDRPESWYLAEKWFRERLKKNGEKVIEIEGLIEPVLHLASKS